RDAGVRRRRGRRRVRRRRVAGGQAGQGPHPEAARLGARLTRSPVVMKLLPLVEHAVKGPVWGCKMCGQCVLHSTGMTCPMTCPKTLRNGPCGGVRADGTCEVKPEMQCVWLKAYERSEKLPLWRGHVDDLRPPVDNTLAGTSAWL